MERLTLDDMIKALKCIASQDGEGDCYADHENFNHMEDDNYKRLVCRDGENLKDNISGREAVGCPYHQKKYGCCFEDGELYWLKDVAELLEELKSYKDLEEQGLLVRLPVKPGTIIYKIPDKLCFDFNILFGRKNKNVVNQEKVFNIIFSKNNWFIQCDKDGACDPENTFSDTEYGKTWFTDREEAKKKLDEIKNA